MTRTARIYRSFFSNEFCSVDLAYGDGGKAQLLPMNLSEWTRRDAGRAARLDAIVRPPAAKRSQAERAASTRAKWAAMQAAKAVRS